MIWKALIILSILLSGYSVWAIVQNTATITKIMEMICAIQDQILVMRHEKDADEKRNFRYNQDDG